MKKTLAFLTITTILASNAALANKFCGPYIGVGLGYGHATGKSQVSVFRNDAAQSFLTRLNGDRSAGGVLGGIHAGWDKVWHDKWLLGLEATGDLSSVDGKIRSQTGNQAFNTSARSKTKMKYAVGANLRAGAVLHDVLGYLTVGWSGARFQQDLSYSDSGTGLPSNAFKRTKKDFLNGVRAGFGMGTMLNEHLMLSGEAAHTWFGKINLRQNISPYNTGAVNTTATAVSDYHPRLLEGRVKLSWKFKAPR